MTRPILTLGATGSFGAGVAQELLRRDRPVRCLIRNPGKARSLLGENPALELTVGDVQDPASLERAAKGCEAIVHAINYPYPQWIPFMERATVNVIDAARREGAPILFPGNVYNLGPQSDRPLTEDAANQPNTKKGTLRAELEEMLRRAAEDGSLRVIILRAGDYFGPTVRNGLVDPIFGNAAHARTLRPIGKMDIPHQWAFVPDLGKAAIDLLALGDQLRPFEVVNFAGYVVPRQDEFFRMVARAAGHPDLAVRPVPWWILRLVGLFDGVVRELMELRYLFDTGVILDGSKLRHLLPQSADTPIEEAVRLTVASYR